MEVELSQRIIDQIAHKVAVIVKKSLRDSLSEKMPELVSTKEAAKILRVSEQTMRRNKDKYPHIKKGDSDQSGILFVRSALLNPAAYAGN